MAQTESVASICTSYITEQRIYFIFCLRVTRLICDGGCLWCCPLSDVLKTSMFLLTLDFRHMHWGCWQHSLFPSWKLIVLFHLLQSFFTLQFLSQMFRHTVVEMLSYVCLFGIFCALLGNTILSLFGLIRLVLGEPVAEPYLKACVKDLLAPWAEC